MTIFDSRPLETLSLEETRQLILDLRTQQAELETQNQALRKSLAEAELHENEGKLHAIIQGSPIPAFAIGKDHKIIHWNKALAKLSGIKAERVVGTKQQWRAFYSEARPCLADLLVDGTTDVIADWYSGKYIPSELVADAYEATDFFPALGEGGKWLRFTASAVRDAHGEMIGAFETLEDVSDRMQAEKDQRSKINAQRALAEANLRIERILNAVHDGLWENDSQKGVFQFSNRMFTMLGYPPMNGAEGFKFLADKIHPADKPDFEQQQKNLLNGSLATWDTIFRMQAADGSWHYILSRGNATGRDSQGRGCRFAGTHTDITEWRLVEAALRESESRYGIVLNALNDGLWDWHVPTGKAFFSPLYYAILGYEDGEFPATFDSWRSLVHPEDIVRVEQGLQQSIENGEGFAIDLRMKMKTGLWRWFSTRGKIVERDAEGKALRMVGMLSDITERKKVTEKLRESELFLNSLLQSIPAPVFYKDRDGRYLGFNQAFEAFFGKTREELIGKSVFDISPVELARVYHEKDVELFERPGTQVYESQVKNARGALRDVVFHKASLTDSAGVVTGLIGVILDVTDSKRAEAALRAEEARMRAITESAQDAILMMNPQGAISFWNQAAERIFGYTAAEAIGQNLHRLIVPQRYHAAHQHAFPRFLETGQGDDIGKTLELGALRRDGLEISVELSLSALELPDGWHSVGILRDISERKRTEEDLREANRKLRAATAKAEKASLAKSEFLANMSHEIRTPMNGVIGMAGLLLDTEMTDEQRRYAEIVRISGESLLGLVNGILDFSKIEAGKLDLEILDFDLLSLLEDVTGTLAFRAFEKGIELTFNFDASVPMFLRGDAGRLRQILNNLGGNAIKFTPSGAVAIRVSVVHEAAPAGQGISNAPPSKAESLLLRFTVRDTGIGIPKEKMEVLFNKFSQVDTSTTRQYGGTGLGLAISKQLAELMGGEIGVTSEAGKGSEFWFTARFRKQAGLSPTMRPVATQYTAREMLNRFKDRNARILLAEDNIINQQVSLGILNKLGLQTDIAANGVEAVNAFETTPYDLILMDVQMPVMDGLEASRKIRDLEEKKAKQMAGNKAQNTETMNFHIPIIAITAHAVRGDRNGCLAAGMDDYLSKPVTPYALGEVLERWLPKDKDETKKMRDERNRVNGKEIERDHVHSSLIAHHSSLIFDRAGMMARLMNDENLANIIVEGFLEDIPRQIEALRGYLDAGDRIGAERQAHTIKGAAANVSGEELRVVASEIEIAAGEGELKTAGERLTALEAAFDRLRKEMKPGD